MNETQLEFKARHGGKSQADVILAILEARRGKWVSLVDLTRASHSYAVHSRIADLRGRGLAIDQKSERVDGSCHSFYMLLGEAHQ